MMPISNMNAGAIRPFTTAGKINETSKNLRPEKDVQNRSRKPETDQYVPAEKREASGRYRLGKDENGQSKIYFDDPERTADAPGQADAVPNNDAPEQKKNTKEPEQKNPGKKAERCVCNTDKPDREIRKLKKKKEKLEQQVQSATDENRRKDLERQLAQVERELSQKDNDNYRKQHSTFTRLA